jgi:hypothetical protein
VRRPAFLCRGDSRARLSLPGKDDRGAASPRCVEQVPSVYQIGFASTEAIGWINAFPGFK